jgi:four helix bundle protein
MDCPDARPAVAPKRNFFRRKHRAVCRAKSNPDFINKLRIVEEECDESLFWMELLVENGIISDKRMRELMKEGNELLAIVVASAKTARASQAA